MGTIVTSQYNTANAPVLKDQFGLDLNSSSVVEIIGGIKAGLKDLQDPNEILYGNFATKDLFRGNGGSLIGTLSGGASVAGNKLLMNNAISKWGFDPSGFTIPDHNILTIRFKYTPNYSGTPAANQGMYREAGTSTTHNMIEMRHISGSGNLTIVFRNSAGSGQGTLTAISGWSPVSGTTYEIELNLNSTLGEARLFVDGIQQGPTHPNSYVRDNDYIEGFFGSTTLVQNFEIKDFQRFNTVKHTANFASEIPRIVSLTKYSTTEQAIEPIACSSPFCFSMQQLDNFSVVTDTADGSIGIIIIKDGVDYYHDGADWIISDGSLAQSNTAAEIVANKGNLIVSPGQDIHFKIVLLSNDGTGTPTITSQETEFEYYFAPTDPSKCQVWGYVYDNCNIVEGASITIKSKRLFDDINGNFISINEVLETDENGYFSVLLSKSENFDAKINVVITFTDSQGEEIERSFTITVPDLDTAPLDSIIV